MPAQAEQAFKTGELPPRGDQGIGSYTMWQQIFRDAPEQSARVDYDFQEIQALLRSELGAGLSPELVRNLGLAQLDWQQVYNPRNLAFLFFGSETPRTRDTELYETAAIIELERAIHSQDDTVCLRGLRVSGVGSTSIGEKRVQGVRYGWHSKRANQIDISVHDTEFPKPDRFPVVYGVNEYNYNMASARIPTPNGDDAGVHAGVVSERMVTLASVIGSRPSRILKVYNSTSTGQSLAFPGYGHLPELRGFRIKSSDETHTITFRPPQGSDLQAWRVHFSGHLT